MNLRLYTLMQRLPWPRSYVGRVLLLCFVGTHVPLICLVVWALARTGFEASLDSLLIALVATLVGTGFTFAAVSNMLVPVLKSVEALDSYTTGGARPDLPVDFRDEAGRLMSSVQRAITQLDGRIGELTLIAITDPLTGVRNRRWLNEVGIAAFEQERRVGGLYALIVLDLDNFKRLNDTLGHVIGDQVLISVADAIRSAVRAGDQTVRTGGDEFCIFLPGADDAVAFAIAERVRTSIAAAISDFVSESGVTASIGVATVQRQDLGFTDLYLRADRNLYRAKERGRNAVIA